MLRAGTLNRRVTIQHHVTGQNEIGQPVDSWENLAKTGDGKVWANIRMLNGREFLSGNAEQAQATASIRIRYREDVTAAMRVLHKDQVYEIVAVLPDEQNREHVDLACKRLEAING